MKKLISICLILSSTFSYSKDYTLINNADLNNMKGWNEVSRAFIINTVAYGILVQLLKSDVENALIASVITTIVLSSLLIISDSRNNAGGSVLNSAIGIGASSACVLVFEF